MLYRKRYWTISEGYRLIGYACGRRYHDRNSALNACMAMSRCKGVTEEGHRNFRLNTGSVPTVESSMKAFVPGGEQVTYKDYDMVYVGYSWEYKSPFTLTGSYQDNTVYKTRDSALSACAATDKCKGVTKEGKNNFRLYTSGTSTYSKNKSVWVQNGAVVREGGYNWSQQSHFTLSGYCSSTVYKTREKALQACGKMKSCRGVTREGDSVFRLMSGSTLKPNSASTSYVKSSSLFISSDYYWTRVRGYRFRHHLGGLRWRNRETALRECTKRVSTCDGLYTQSGWYYLAKGTDLERNARGEVYILGSPYEKQWFFVYGGELCLKL